MPLAILQGVSASHSRKVPRGQFPHFTAEGATAPRAQVSCLRSPSHRVVAKEGAAVSPTQRCLWDPTSCTFHQRPKAAQPGEHPPTSSYPPVAPLPIAGADQAGRIREQPPGPTASSHLPSILHRQPDWPFLHPWPGYFLPITAQKICVGHFHE